MHKIIPAVLAIIIAAGIASCSPRRFIIGQIAESLEIGADALERDDDLEMLAQALPAHIKTLEALAAGDPQNGRLLVLLSRLYGSYGFLFLEGRLDAAEIARRSGGQSAIAAQRMRVSRCYEKGLQYGLRALALRDPQLPMQLQRVNTAAGALQHLEASSVPALFWYGFNLAGYVNHNRRNVLALAAGFLVEKAMLRVVELDPGYDHGAAHMVLMIYYGSRPPAMGGDLPAARRHYERFKQITAGRMRLADVYYARYVLVQSRRRDDFVNTLQGVVSRSGEDDPAFRLFNAVAAKRAASYLELSGRLFEE